MKKLIFISLVLISTSLFSNAQLEIPTPLTDRPSLIIHHTGYTVSYNTIHGTPNWSAWVLTSTMVRNGTLKRSDVFLADPAVPVKYRVLPTDYQGSGYDRGHMCPAADMAWSASAMHDCFYMSNMAPQTPTLNRVYWKQLEDKCRKWVISEDTLYIVSGPVFSKTSNKSIGRTHKIDVPTGFFKVILSLRKGHAKAIGFYYVNNSLKQPLSFTATTVDAIEQLTGIDFFSSLPDSIENVVESQCNLNDWR